MDFEEFKVTRHCLPGLFDMSSLSDLLPQLSHSVTRTGGPVMGAQRISALLPGSGGSFMELVIRNPHVSVSRHVIRARVDGLHFCFCQPTVVSPVEVPDMSKAKSFLSDLYIYYDVRTMCIYVYKKLKFFCLI
ncbi:hypothetical protein CsSME_00010223 [Camellia sinensis var. sinensis]